MLLRKVALALVFLFVGSNAYALTLPSTGNGSLMLTAFDVSTETSYVLDTGITLDQVLGGAPISVNSDPLFAVFNDNGADLNNVLWNLSASDNTANNPVVDNFNGRRLLTTAPSGVGGLTNTGLSSSQIRIENFIIEVNDAIGGNNAVASNSLGDNFNAGNTAGIAPFSSNFGGSFPAGNAGNIGDTLELLLITAGSSVDFFGNETFGPGDAVVTAATQIFASLDSNGVLSVTAVPLPAAVWLFGAGLAGLIGFGRRKVQAVAA